MARMNRRDFMKVGAAAALAALSGCAEPVKNAPRVVVVGGGFGGATAAKYLRLWSQGGVHVTLIERHPMFVSCPMSNLVVGGQKTLADLTLGYDNLQSKRGVQVIHAEVASINPDQRRVVLADGGSLPYDRLVLSPGVDFMFEQLPGLAGAEAQAKVLHAWKAGPQTVALRQQLEDMRDGGVYAIAIPKAPYRCPPGPYERACLVADYFKRAKPKSKVVILDANEEVVSKKPLFMKAWAELYKDILEYRPGSEVKDVDARTHTAILEFDKFTADVLNVLPPQRAGDIAARSGLKLVNQRWVDIDWLSMEAADTPGIHVLGDAVLAAPAMPKSAHMANQQAKLAAAAILELLEERAPSPTPVLANTCYSFVDTTHAVHIASVHQYDAASRSMQPVKGAGGLSPSRTELEGRLAEGWANTIWADTLA